MWFFPWFRHDFADNEGFASITENYTFFDSIREVGYVFPHLYALETRTLLWFGHGCTGNRMLSKHKRYYGLGMDALVAVCSRNTNVITVLAWMIW